MSGTQDNFLSAENSAKSEDLQAGQAGSDETMQEVENAEQEHLTPAQKMDNLLRKNTASQLKKEVERLRKEAAKYRKASKEEFMQKTELLKKAEEISCELEELRSSNRNLKIMRTLDKAGCMKSDLVVKDVPSDCENIEDFVKSYKERNPFLFKAPKNSVGGSFKSSATKNLTPSQQMNAYIRAALGR